MAKLNNPTRFDVWLGAAKVASTGVDSAPSIIVTASSDAIDLGIDRFTLSALEQMRDAFPGMTIFMDHHYSVANGDVFGAVKSATIVQRDGHNDLDLEILVALSNPKAAGTYELIRSGVRLGVSVGVLVEDADFSQEIVDGRKTKVCNIKSVKTLEASIVGIPANRRSWVSGALKAASFYFNGEQRAILEKLADSIPSSVGGDIMAVEDETEEDEIHGSDDQEVEEPDAVENVEAVPDHNPVDDSENGETDGGDEASHDDVVDQADNAEEETEDTDDTSDETAATPDDTEEEEDADEQPSDDRVSRGEIIQALRQKYTEPDRDWFTIKDVTEVEPEEGKEPETVVEVLIYDAIGDGMGAKDFVRALESITASRINVRLNSPGGIIDDGIAIRNALLRHPADVYTYVDGLAASMASVIALAGKEVVMEPDSMFMIHEPWGCAMGNTHDMAREARILDKYASNIAGAYARKAGGTKQEWRDVMREEGWYTPEDALDAGLIDRIGDGTYASEQMKDAQFDDRIAMLLKHVPTAASHFFVKASEPDKVADVSDIAELVTAVGSLHAALRSASTENEALRTKVAELEKSASDSVKEWDDTNILVSDILTEVEKVLDAPLPRKIVPEAAFSQIAEKWPWLDERIINQLARFNKESDA